MKVFNYEKYHQAVERIMARTGGWRNVLAKKYIPATQYTLGNFYNDCRDKERMLDVQLEGIAKTLQVDTDFVPYLEPWHGVGVYAEAFGCPFEWRENDSPWVHPIVHDFEDFKQLSPPEYALAKMLNYVLETVTYFDRQTQGQIPISLTDTQSPLDNATLICDTTFFFLACYEHPDEVKTLLQWITDLILESSRQQRALMHAPAQPGHIMWSPLDGKGLSIAEDNLVMIHPDHYREFAEPYNLQLAKAFDGLAVHSCGSWKQHFRGLGATPGLLMCDLAQHLSVDPNPNNLEDILEGFRGTKTLVQVRTGIDPDDPDGSLGWIDELRGPGFPMIVQIPFHEDSKIANHNWAVLRNKLDRLVERDW